MIALSRHRSLPEEFDSLIVVLRKSWPHVEYFASDETFIQWASDKKNLQDGFCCYETKMICRRRADEEPSDEESWG